MNVMRASIYCRRCSYVLDGLDRERCPECGNPFDPTNCASYETMPRWARWRRRLLRSCIALAGLGTLGGFGYAAGRIPPSLCVVEVIRKADSADYDKVTFVVKNRSLSPMGYSGYSRTFPLYGMRRRALGANTWTDRGSGWCGVGARIFRLVPGESATFTASLYGCDRRTDEMQVGLWVRHAGRRGMVWSETFTLARADQR